VARCFEDLYGAIISEGERAAGAARSSDPFPVLSVLLDVQAVLQRQRQGQGAAAAAAPAAAAPAAAGRGGGRQQEQHSHVPKARAEAIHGKRQR
jgi:hypothetical protein